MVTSLSVLGAVIPHPRGPREDSVERALLESILTDVGHARVLEAGTGIGRLTPILSEGSLLYCGIDIETSVLHRVAGAVNDARSSGCAAADIHHLPFRSSTFDLVVLVRVYHRLASPSQALDEIQRVLRPGGHLLLSSHPRPSFRTLYQDLSAVLQRGTGARSLTFTRDPTVEIEWGEQGGRVETRALTERRLREAGFSVRARYVTGFEELPIGRQLPASFWSRSAAVRKPFPWAPCVFFVAERTDGRERSPSPPSRR